MKTSTNWLWGCVFGASATGMLWIAASACSIVPATRGGKPNNARCDIASSTSASHNAAASRPGLANVPASSVGSLSNEGPRTSDKPPLTAGVPGLTVKRPTGISLNRVRVQNAMTLAAVPVWTSPLDSDADGDVDGDDYGVFVGCFNGTGNPVPMGCGARFGDMALRSRYEALFAPKTCAVYIKDAAGNPYPIEGTVEFRVQYATGASVGTVTMSGAEGTAPLTFVQN